MVMNMAMAMVEIVPATPSRETGRRGGRTSRRARHNVAARAALALVVVTVGYFSVTFSLAHVLVKVDPGRAHQLASYDGRNTARLSAKLIGPGTTSASRLRGGELAKLALKQAPTVVAAASTLGINAQIQGDEAGARRAFVFAQKLSRRDPISQLWAIEDSVARGDIRGALRHYDIALRTKPALAGVLFPVLTAAVSEPLIRTELVRTLATKPAWSEDFVNQAAIQGKDPRGLAAMFVDLRRARIAVPEMAQAGLVNSLLANSLIDQAWSYYRSIRAGADRRRLRDPDFKAALAVPSNLDWTAINVGGVTTTIANGTFEYFAPASVGGVLLQQMQVLPAGAYRLVGISDRLDQSAAASPYWALACRDGRELGRVEMPALARNDGKFGGVLQVPAGCPVQVLTLVARASDSVSGSSGRIDRVELFPI